MGNRKNKNLNAENNKYIAVMYWIIYVWYIFLNCTYLLSPPRMCRKINEYIYHIPKISQFIYLLSPPRMCRKMNEYIYHIPKISQFIFALYFLLYGV